MSPDVPSDSLLSPVNLSVNLCRDINFSNESAEIIQELVSVYFELQSVSGETCSEGEVGE